MSLIPGEVLSVALEQQLKYFDNIRAEFMRPGWSYENSAIFCQIFVRILKVE